MFVLAGVSNYNFIPTDGGFLDKLFHQTWLAISVFGNPANGYKLTLIGLIIIAALAVIANFVTEQLTGRKVGSQVAAIVVTIIGSLLFQTYVLLPFDFALEGVRIIAALLGAIVIAVFWVLIAGKVKGK